MAFFISVFILFIMRAECGDHIPERPCAIFYSGKNFYGDQFTLNDFDQTVELKKEWRHALHNWWVTFLVDVEDGCVLKICDNTFLRGTCMDLVNANKTPSFNGVRGSFQNVSLIKSAMCTCERKCDCESINILKDLSDNPNLGRAYLVGGCRTCDTKYVQLLKSESSPSWHNETFEAVILRTGCSLKVYSQQNFKGGETSIAGPIHEGRLTIKSYKTSCDVAKYIAPPPPSVESYYPLKINFPSNKDAFLEMLKTNETLSAHPGFKDALHSARERRSHRNAYVILFGTHNAFISGFPQCQAATLDKIGECRIPISMDEFGISAELCVITVPIVTDLGSEATYKLMAGLEDYLSTQEELTNAIPNVIIFHHELFDRDFSTNSAFHLKYMALHTLRARLLDEDYPNVVFLLSQNSDRRFTGKKGWFWEKEVTESFNCTFAKPFIFSSEPDLRSLKFYINGYAEMGNKVFWPKNLEENVETICLNGGDPLGDAIFKAAFHDTQTPYYSIKPILHDVPVDESKWSRFKDKTCDSPPPEPSVWT